MPIRSWLVVVVTALSGCAGWQAVQLEPDSFTPAPSEMRVTRKDGWQAVITAPRFENDTVRGIRAEAPFDSIAMPASQVRSLAVLLPSNRDGAARLGVLAGFLAVFFGLWCLALCGGYQT